MEIDIAIGYLAVAAASGLGGWLLAQRHYRSRLTQHLHEVETNLIDVSTQVRDLGTAVSNLAQRPSPHLPREQPASGTTAVPSHTDGYDDDHRHLRNSPRG